MPEPLSILYAAGKSGLVAAGALGIRVALTPLIQTQLERFRNEDKEVETLFQRAIFRTKKRHLHCADRLEASLNMWIQSHSWADVFSGLITGNSTPLELTRDFLDNPHFQHTLNEADRPQKVAEDFLQLLLQVYLTHPEFGELIKMARGDAQYQQLHQGMQNMHQDLHLGFSQLSEQVQNLTGFIGPTAAVHETAAERELKRMVDLVNQKRRHQAFQAAKQFESEHLAELSELSQARFYRLKGSIFVLQHEWQQATQAFQKAFNLDSTTAEAHLSLGYGLYLSSELEQALHHLGLALDLKPGLDEALALQAECQYKRRNADALRALIPMADGDHPALGDVLFNRLIQLDQFREAQQVLEIQLHHHPESPHWKHMQARLVFEEGMDASEEKRPQTMDLPVGQVLQLLDEAMDQYRKEERFLDILEILKTRAGLLTMEYRHEEALEDCVSGLTIDPGAQHLWLYRAHLLMVLGKPKQALAALDQVTGESYQKEKHRLWLQLLQDTQDFQGQLGVVERYLPLVHDQPDLQAYLELVRTFALYKTASKDAALKHLDTLQDPHPLLDVARAEIHQEEQEFDLAEQWYRKAFEGHGGKDHCRVGKQLAFFYAQQGQFLQAADVLESILGEMPPLRMVEQAVDWNARADRYDLARKWVDHYRSRKEQVPVEIAYADANLHLFTGDFRRAVEILAPLVKDHPSPALDRLLARALNFQGNHQQLEEVLDRIFNHPDASSNVLFEAAEHYQRLGKLQQAIKCAFRAHRKAGPTPEADGRYVQLGLSCDQHLDMPETVLEECAVQFEDDAGETSWLVFTADETRGRSELPLTHSLFQELAGKKVGDTLTFQNLGFEKTVKIKTIWPKEGYLLHTIMKETSPATPLQHGFVTLKADPEHLDTLVAQLMAQTHTQGQKNDDIRTLQVKHKMPVSVLVEASRRNEFDFWWQDLRSVHPIYSCTLTEAEDEEAQQVLEGPGVVLDASALLTLHKTGALHLLHQRWERVVIPPHLRVELRNHLESLQAPGQVDTEQIQAMQEVLAFVGTCEDMPVPSMLGERCPDCRWAEIMTDATWSVVLAAHEQNLAVYTEDLGLKRTLHQGLTGLPPIRVVSTFHFLTHALGEEWITEQDFRHGLHKLLESQFLSLPVDGEMFLEAIQGLPEQFLHFRGCLLAFLHDDTDQLFQWIRKALEHVQSSTPEKFQEVLEAVFILIKSVGVNMELSASYLQDLIGAEDTNIYG